jgi:4-azaleucine resistance transporter AzlC
VTDPLPLPGTTIEAHVAPPDPAALAESRRQLLLDALGIAVSAVGFGFVYGLAAREAGFSPIEVIAMSTIVFAGAAQFAAVGYVSTGLAWPAIVLLTALLNARHLLYSAALAPWLRQVPIWRRAVMAHLLTDEAFALTIAHFQRIGRTDERGFWIAAIASTFIPWNLATFAGSVLGGQIPDPNRFGIDIIFPAAMIGLAVGLVTGRRELVAAIVGAGVGVVMALLTSPPIGIVAGGLVGPAVGLLLPASAARETAPIGTPASAERYAMPGSHVTPGPAVTGDLDAPAEPPDRDAPAEPPDRDGAP